MVILMTSQKMFQWYIFFKDPINTSYLTGKHLIVYAYATPTQFMPEGI